MISPLNFEHSRWITNTSRNEHILQPQFPVYNLQHKNASRSEAKSTDPKDMVIDFQGLKAKRTFSMFGFAKCKRNNPNRRSFHDSMFGFAKPITLWMECTGKS
jgi:hypothetical protein